MRVHYHVVNFGETQNSLELRVIDVNNIDEVTSVDAVPMWTQYIQLQRGCTAKRRLSELNANEMTVIKRILL